MGPEAFRLCLLVTLLVTTGPKVGGLGADRSCRILGHELLLSGKQRGPGVRAPGPLNVSSSVAPLVGATFSYLEEVPGDASRRPPRSPHVLISPSFLSIVRATERGPARAGRSPVSCVPFRCELCLVAQSSGSAPPSRRLTSGLLSEFAGVDDLSTVHFSDGGSRDGHYG